MVLLFALLAVVAEKTLTAPEDCRKLYALGRLCLTWDVFENGKYPDVSRTRCVLCNMFLTEGVAVGFIRGLGDNGLGLTAGKT